MGLITLTKGFKMNTKTRMAVAEKTAGRALSRNGIEDSLYSPEDVVQDMFMHTNPKTGEVSYVNDLLEWPPEFVKSRAYRRATQLIKAKFGRAVPEPGEDIKEKFFRDGKSVKCALSVDIADVYNTKEHEDAGLMVMENKELSEKCKKILDNVGREVLNRVLIYGETFVQVGTRLNMSKSKANRIYNESIQKLRDSELIKDLG